MGNAESLSLTTRPFVDSVGHGNVNCTRKKS